MSAWDNYDNWLLQGSGVEDNTPEMFETEKWGYFTLDDSLAIDFDELIEKAEKDNSCFDLVCDTMEEYAEHIAEKLGLDSSEEACLTAREEYEQGLYEDACENGYKGRRKRLR